MNLNLNEWRIVRWNLLLHNPSPNRPNHAFDDFAKLDYAAINSGFEWYPFECVAIGNPSRSGILYVPECNMDDATAIVDEFAIILNFKIINIGLPTTLKAVCSTHINKDKLAVLIQENFNLNKLIWKLSDGTCFP